MRKIEDAHHKVGRNLMYDREEHRFSEVIQVYLPLKINQEE